MIGLKYAFNSGEVVGSAGLKSDYDRIEMLKYVCGYTRIGRH